jgi:hypothetical protein
MDALNELRRAQRRTAASAAGVDPQRGVSLVGDVRGRDALSGVHRLPEDPTSAVFLQDEAGAAFFMLGVSALDGPDILS